MKSIRLVELAVLLGHPELVSEGAQLEAWVDQLGAQVDRLSASRATTSIEMLFVFLEVQKMKQEVINFLLSLGGIVQTSVGFDVAPQTERPAAN